MEKERTCETESIHSLSALDDSAAKTYLFLFCVVIENV